MPKHSCDAKKTQTIETAEVSGAGVDGKAGSGTVRHNEHTRASVG